MIKLGSVVRDNLTGFTGVATGRAEYLYGCTRVLIEPKELKEGKPMDSVWFDEQRIETIQGERPFGFHSSESSAKSGGPQNDPIVKRGV